MLKASSPARPLVRWTRFRASAVSLEVVRQSSCITPQQYTWNQSSTVPRFLSQTPIVEPKRNLDRRCCPTSWVSITFSPHLFPEQRARLKAALDDPEALRLVVDLNWAESASGKELSSLVKQLCYVYGRARASLTPPRLTLASYHGRAAAALKTYVRRRGALRAFFPPFLCTFCSLLWPWRKSSPGTASLAPLPNAFVRASWWCGAFDTFWSVILAQRRGGYRLLSIGSSNASHLIKWQNEQSTQFLNTPQPW